MKIKYQIAALAALALSSIVNAQTYPYQNHQLSAEQRAADLCSRLTLDEKVSLMMNTSPAIERLGIPAFNWWSEALHGVGRNGVATVFPSCIGMAASFDDDLIEKVFTAVSDEARAKNTSARNDGTYGQYKGLSFWTPNINIFRDPRWGRGQETYGEDPYMNAQMGLRVVRGLQDDPSQPYLKTLACAKHYAVHSGPEKTRHSFNITDLPERDLWETYLPAFKTLVQEGNVRQVMCAYHRYNDKPCCGSDQLLQSILRDKWGYDGVVVSDCGAINDFYREGHHEVSADAKAAAALGVRAGTDVECGSVYRNLAAAVKRGDLTEEDIDICVIRLLTERFRVGDFDDDSIVSYTSIPMSVVSCDAHKALAHKMAQEQMVLLKNNGVLPLAKNVDKIIVMGPNANDSIMPWGIYYGQPAHTVTVLEGIENKIGKVPYVKTCGITTMADEESIFNLIKSPDGKEGFLAEYWNNTNREGNKAAVTHYAHPLSLDNGGNTVFEPGVNLTQFSTRLTGVYTPIEDETIDMVFGYEDTLRIIVNGDTLLNRRQNHGVRRDNRTLSLKKNTPYNIIIDYVQLEDAATLSFDILRSKPMSTQKAVQLAGDANTVIFVGGISPTLEKEEAKVTAPGFDNGDRTSIELPQCQRDILRALHDAGKKIVFVNCSGSAVALTPEAEICDAILQAWYPGEQGGHAVADVLFGDYNPSGKLPITFYKSDAQLPDFDDYHMIGRTYRYIKEEPLYRFGHGLSYTTFKISQPTFTSEGVKVNVENTGNVDGTEVIQVYIRRVEDKQGPNLTLRGYKRVDLAAGENKEVVIPMPAKAFETWSEADKCMRVVKGDHQILVGNSSDPANLQILDIQLQ